MLACFLNCSRFPSFKCKTESGCCNAFCTDNKAMSRLLSWYSNPGRLGLQRTLNVDAAGTSKTALCTATDITCAQPSLAGLPESALLDKGPTSLYCDNGHL